MKNNIEEKINYCLNCKSKPCSLKGCPLNNNIPGFIQSLKQENYLEAYKTLLETTVLSGVCGRICPHTKQCQGSCVRGIKGEPVSIGVLEAYVFDKIHEKKSNVTDCYEKKERKNKKVAIIGGGPSGLTCAAFLAKEGVDVTIYEKYNYLGGLLIYGIPEFRLPKDIVNMTIKDILNLGIKVEYNKEITSKEELEKIKNDYDAIFLGIGTNCSVKMNIEGETLEGVFGGNELLEYNLHPEYTDKKVIVVGGGNVAMDCARTINKLGAEEVTVVYRRAEEQMPAEKKEIDDAKEEGVKFIFQNNLVKIIGENKVQQVELIKTKLVEKKGERPVPVNIENSNYKMNVDYIVMALGSEPQKYVKNLGLELNKWGNIDINDKYQTSNNKIYAGGDVAGVKGTVAYSAKSGREAAKNILKNLGINN
mgnify:FL=1